MSDPTRDTTSPEAIERARVLDFIDRLGELSDEHLMWVLAGARCERRDRNEAEPDRGDEWDPWAELRRREHLDLGWADLPGTTRGLYQVVDRRRVATRKVLLSSRLRDGDDRDRTLTHELVHDERRIPTLGEVDRAEAEAEEAVVMAITEERMTSRRWTRPASHEILDRLVELCAALEPR